MDYRLEQLINGPAGSHPVWDALMAGAAYWGEAIFIGVVALWFLLGWWRGSAGDREGALGALLAAGLALAVNVAISHVWARPRPFVAHPGTVHMLLAHTRDASFPSDHASAGFAVATVLSGRHRRLGALAFAFAILMSYARVYVGAHYPGDVAAGLVIGVLAGILFLSWLEVIAGIFRRLADAVILWLRLPLPNADAGGSTRVSRS